MLHVEAKETREAKQRKKVKQGTESGTQQRSQTGHRKPHTERPHRAGQAEQSREAKQGTGSHTSERSQTRHGKPNMPEKTS